MAQILLKKSSQENKNNNQANFNWSVLMIISLSSIVAGLYRDGFAALFPFLRDDFNLTRAQLGLHSTFFFFAMVLVIIISGRIVDHKGSRWSLLYGLLFMGIFLIIHSFVYSYLWLLILAAFTGLVVSISLPAASKGIVEFFPQKWRNMAFGIRGTAFPFGGMLGSIAFPFMAIMMGWRKTILLPGILAFLCVFLTLKFYQDNGKGKENLKKNRENRLSFWKDFKKLIRNTDLMTISFFGFFLGVTTSAIANHFALFLYLDFGFTEHYAGLGFAGVQAGSIVGRLIWGIICDKFLRSNRSKTFLYMGFLFTIFSFILAWLGEINPSFTVLFIFAFLVGCTGRGWQGIYPSYVTETVKEEKIGMGISFSVLFTHSGIMIASPIFGYIADLNNSYQLSWILLGVIMFLASLTQYIVYINLNTKKENTILD